MANFWENAPVIAEPATDSDSLPHPTEESMQEFPSLRPAAVADSPTDGANPPANTADWWKGAPLVDETGANWWKSAPLIEDTKEPSALNLFGFQVADKTNRALQGLFRFMGSATYNEENRKDAEHVADALERYRQEKFPEYYGVNPDDLKSTKGKIAGAAANVFDIGPGPAVMVTKLAAETYGSSFDESVGRQVAAGETDEAAIRDQARKDAQSSIFHMAPIMMAYAAGGRIAGKAAESVLPEAAGPISRFVTGGAAATAANLATSAAVRGWEDAPIVGDLGQNLTDIFFGMAGGIHAAIKPRIELGQRPVAEGVGRTEVLAEGTPQPEPEEVPREIVPRGALQEGEIEPTSLQEVASAPATPRFVDDPSVPFMAKDRVLQNLRDSGLSEEEIGKFTTRDVQEFLGAPIEPPPAAPEETSPATIAAGAAQPEASVPSPAATSRASMRLRDAVERRRLEAQATPPSEQRPLTEGERARAEYEGQMTEDLRGPQPGEGDELIEAVHKAGGLPSKSNPARSLLRAEIDDLEETAKASPGVKTIGLFRTDAPHLDELATRLRDRGFPIQTPSELIDVLDNRIRTGRQIYAMPAVEAGRAFAQGASTPPSRPGSVLTHHLKPGDIINWRGERRTIARIAGAKAELRTSPNGTTYPFVRPAEPGEQSTMKLAAQHYVVFDNGDAIVVNRPGRVTKYHGTATQIREPAGETAQVAEAPAEAPEVSNAPAKRYAYGSSTPKAARAVAQEAAAELPEASKELHRAIPQPPAGAPAAAANIAGQALDPQLGPKRMTQLIYRAAFGKEYGARRRADAAMQVFKKDFDQTPVPRNWTYTAGQPLPRNYEIQRAIDMGDTANLTSHEQAFAQTMRRLLDEGIAAIHEVSPNSLRDLYETYFPRLWKDAERNANRIRQWMGRRPLEGPKSFLKQRTHGDWLEGVAMGLRPAFDNPVDMTMAKLGEIWRFVGTRTAFAEMKANGLRKFIYAFEPSPDGWREVNDPSSKVYAPPFVTIPEAFDEQLKVKTVELLQSLGVPHSRLSKLGGKRWGTYEPTEGIKTRFAGPLSVYWHELGHALEERYHFLDTVARDARTPMLSGRSEIENQLRKLADLRMPEAGAPKSFQKYIRTKDEKAAVILEAYLHAPEKMRDVAPNVYTRFKKFIADNPELHDINRIRPSLALGSGEQQLDLGGLVQLGRWMSPEPAARVIETIVSPGIQSHTWYRGLRAINGLLTSVRLAGFFHGGMVTNDSQYAAIGLAINDVLSGHPVRGMKEVLKSPLMLPRAYRLGQRVMRAIDFPENADEQTRALAQTALDANLRSHIGAYDITMSRMWKRALNEALSSPSLGAAWETFWRAPFAIVSKGMAPVMEHLVPQLKYGMHGMQATRILADHPDADPMLLRDMLAKSVDSVEDRIGQVTYDNLFLNRAIKDTAQLGLTAFGWHLTKYRGVFGGAADWTRAAKAVATGKTPEITYRMTYLPAMVIGHALIGGTIHYLMTGKRPDKMLDYLFPEAGVVDELGRPVRLAIADYVKDLAYEWTELRQHGLPGLVGAQVSRLAPIWNMGRGDVSQRRFLQRQGLQ